MDKKSKIGLESDMILKQNEAYASINLDMDYCDFRLKSLAKKIKADCLKFKKQEMGFVNP